MVKPSFCSEQGQVAGHLKCFDELTVLYNVENILKAGKVLAFVEEICSKLFVCWFVENKGLL